MSNQPDINTEGGDYREIDNRGQYAEGDIQNQQTNSQVQQGFITKGESQVNIKQLVQINKIEVTIKPDKDNDEKINNITQIDPEIYNQYLIFTHLSENDPQLRDAIQKTSFEPLTEKVITTAIARTKSVSVHVELPIRLGQGQCKIQFSTQTLRGVTLIFSHKEILELFIVGLNSSTSSKTRKFLMVPFVIGEKNSENVDFFVNLIYAEFMISHQEADEFCQCIDFAIGAYRETMIMEEKAIKIFSFPLIDYLDRSTVKLFSVSQELWKFMLLFSEKHEYTKGNTEWHIFGFDRNFISIQGQYPWIRKASIFSGHDFEKLNLNYDDDVPLIFYFDHMRRDFEKNLWIDHIGQKGIWDAEFLEQWLLNKMIPAVVSHYATNPTHANTLIEGIVHTKHKRFFEKNFNNEATIKSFVSKISLIQVWAMNHRESFESSILKDYYINVGDLVLQFSPEIKGIDYLLEKLSWIEISTSGQEYYEKTLRS